MTARILAVAGASGGLGSSTLACAIARRATAPAGSTPPRLRVALVDLHLGGGGLDVTACAEHLQGLRWPDLLEVDGAVDGPSLLARLPSPDGLPVLAARGVPPPGPVVAAVLHGVLEATDLVVLDAAPATIADLAAGQELVGGLDTLLLAGLSARHLADAEAARGALNEAPHVHLGTRGPRATDVSEAVAAHLDLPLVGHLPDDPRVAVDAHRGVPPGARSGGGPSRLADLAIEAMGAGPAGRGAGWGTPEWPSAVLAS